MACALLYFVLSVLFFTVYCQQPNFEDSITRECLGPDPVGELQCVVNRITLPYVASWVNCTSSLGENLKTVADLINYRCESVWEGKGVRPELIYMRECVKEKFGLRGPSAEIEAAYMECKNIYNLSPQSVRTAPIQQQIRSSSVEFKPLNQRIQVPVLRPLHQTMQVLTPIQQNKTPRLPPFQQVTQAQMPIQEILGPDLQQHQPELQLQGPIQHLQLPLYNPQQSFEMQMQFQQTQPALIQPFQQVQVPFKYAQAQFPNQQQNVNRAFLSRKNYF